MKKITFTLVFTFLAIASYSQVQTTDSIPAIVRPVQGLQSAPEYPGGLKKFYDFISPKIQRSMRYKPGKMIVTFIVEKDGSITDIKTKQGIEAKFDERVREIIAKSPKWKPGSQSGKPIRCSFSIPLTFN